MSEAQSLGRVLQVEVDVPAEQGPASARYASRTEVANFVLRQVKDIPVETVINAMSDTIDAIAEAFRPKPGGPESCQLKFGIKIAAAGNLILAKMGTDVSLEVTLTWKDKN
jgi:hypothetical protein